MDPKSLEPQDGTNGNPPNRRSLPPQLWAQPLQTEARNPDLNTDSLTFAPKLAVGFSACASNGIKCFKITLRQCPMYILYVHTSKLGKEQSESAPNAIIGSCACRDGFEMDVNVMAKGCPAGSCQYIIC